MKELFEKIGKKANVKIGGLVVEVVITDVKMSYGKERYQITPVAGAGSVWIEQVAIIG